MRKEKLRSFGFGMPEEANRSFKFDFDTETQRDKSRLNACDMFTKQICVLANSVKEQKPVRRRFESGW